MFNQTGLTKITDCNSPRKILRYKETIATIKSNGKYDRIKPLFSGLISGSMLNTNDLNWTNYTFNVNGVEYGGEATSGLYFGEKFIVKYDSSKLDNDHNFLILYKPIFLYNEKIGCTLGKIKTIFGNTGSTIRVTFQYCIPYKKSNIDSIMYLDKNMSLASLYDNSNNSDSINLCFIKTQYLEPITNVGDLRKKMNKEYKVLYSIDNPKRAILYIDSFYCITPFMNK